MPTPAPEPLTQALRLFTILHLVASRKPGRPLGKPLLAQACACDPKTIQRAIKALRSANIPIEYDPSERSYVLPEKDWAFSLQTLTRADALALALLRGLLADTFSALPFAQEIEMALDKATMGLSPPLRTQMESLVASLTDLGGLARDYSQAPLRPLLNGLTLHFTVEILYDSRSSRTCGRRLVDPYRLDRRDGRYLELQAWCHQRHSVRTFALDRILEARLTEQRFVMRDWEASDEGVVGSLRDSHWVAVEVRFDAEVAAFARERRWPFKARFEATGEGRVILRGRVQGVEGMVRELLSWRRHAEVLGGPELRARFVEEVRALANIYQEG